MPSLHEKVEAELEQMERALSQLPEARRLKDLSVLELGIPSRTDPLTWLTRFE